MQITLRRAEDEAELKELIRVETNAKQRDRLRAVQLAIMGESTLAIMQMLGRSRGFVQRWCYAYRDGGLDAVNAKSPPGRSPRLSPEQCAAFKQRVLDGPIDSDGVCALRGHDLVRILHEEHHAPYTLSGTYKLLHRLNLNVLVPRPQHRKSDPVAMQQWVEDAPFLSKTSAKNIRTSASPSGSRTKRASASKAR